MTPRILGFVLTLILLATSTVSAVNAQERDSLAPVFSMEAPPFEAFPPEVIAPQNAEAIIALVDEARLFGVPVAVRVVSASEGHPRLPQLDDQDASSRIPDDVMREMAQGWMADEPIESAPGAEDGFLMLVIIPEDHTQSSAIIQPAPNALPLNGLTQANIDDVLQTLVLPSFAEGQVSQGIRNGLSVFSYNNLFGRPERLELDDLHEDLQLVAGVPLAGATVAGAIGLAALAFWIDRRQRAEPAAEREVALSPFSAAALHDGRVTDAVVAGGLLELIRQGALLRDDGGLRVTAADPASVRDPFLVDLLDVLRMNADRDGTVSHAALRRLHDLTGPARRRLEDRLATAGLYNRDGKVELMWLLLGSALVAAIGLFTLIPSILGMARFGILAISFAAIVIVAVLVWATRRSWTTARGREALEAWQRTAPVHERIAFDTVVHQDDLISALGGPFTPATINLVRTLRGLGAT